MGSYNMAVNKILSVLLVAGSTPAWTNPQFNFNFNNNIGTERPISSTTPVPILRYLDSQNIDGSYTYGYGAADGTYKLETRFVDGRVKGKYGYIDPEGNLREASYGAEAGRGFEPLIERVELPAPVVAPQETFNEIPQPAAPAKQFQNFEPTNKNVKIVNGRRALLKKVRRVKATPAPKQFIDEQATKQANLKARQEQLRSLEQHRRQLLKVQQQQQRQPSSRQQQSRAFSSFPPRQPVQQESFRSAQPVPASGVSDPYISGFDLSSGSYSYSY